MTAGRLGRLESSLKEMKETMERIILVGIYRDVLGDNFRYKFGILVMKLSML